MSSNKFRLYATTGAVAAITATGAWYGAGINIRQEFKQQQKEISQTLVPDPEQKLSQLETSKKKLLQQREELQKKIEKLEAGKSLSEGGNGRILPER